MRYWRYIPGLLLAGPALGFDCSFTVECFEAEACADSSFAAEVAIDTGQIVTDFGDLQITGTRRDDQSVTLFAKGDGADYMLSTTPQAARLSVHMHDGPLSVSYHGTCEMPESDGG